MGYAGIILVFGAFSGHVRGRFWNKRISWGLFGAVCDTWPQLCAIVNKGRDRDRDARGEKKPTFLLGRKKTPLNHTKDLDINRFLDIGKYHNTDL